MLPTRPPAQRRPHRRARTARRPGPCSRPSASPTRTSARPLIGVANTWIEIGPCNYHLKDLAAARQGGHPRGRRHAPRVQHRLDLRRHHHGHRRHEGVAGQPRGDRRLDRTGRARQPLRRPGRAGRLRQDDSRRRDGAGPPRHPGHGPLRRLDRAGHLGRPRRHHPGRVRGRRRPRGRPARRRPADGASRTAPAPGPAPAAASSPPTRWPPSASSSASPPWAAAACRPSTRRRPRRLRRASAAW